MQKPVQEGVKPIFMVPHAQISPKGGLRRRLKDRRRRQVYRRLRRRGRSLPRQDVAYLPEGNVFAVALHGLVEGLDEGIVPAVGRFVVILLAEAPQSDGNFMWALSGGRSGGAGAGGSFAPWIRSYMRRSGAPEHIGWKVAVKDRKNGAKNPYAHVSQADITIEAVKESPMIWDPIHFLEVCPSSDGAAAMVVTNAAGAKRAPRPPAWVISHAKRTEFAVFPGRDPIKPAAGVECAKALYQKARITDPRRQIDCAELYVPFSWFEPMWLEGHLICEEGEGWKMVDSGATEIGGDFPVNMSGGVLCSNPIGASGMLRLLEPVNQVRGTAGDYQVEGARVALGQAYGGASNYFAMWIVSSEPSPTFS